jgi:hypothetical protein
MSEALDKPMEPVKFSDDGEGGPEVKMYRDFFQDVKDRKPSPLSPEVALESAKLAYGADISIRENRVVTAKDFPAI